MRPIRWCIAGLAVAGLACQTEKRTAETELARADSAVNALNQEAVQVVPDQVAPLTGSLSTAKAAFAEENYEGAIAGAKNVQAAAAQVQAAVPARRDSLAKELETLSQAMPRNLDSIHVRIEAAERGRRPRGLDAEGVARVKHIHDSARAAWPGITALIQSGDLAQAFAKSVQLRNRVSEALLALGLAADERAWGNLQRP
ncbi:MAG: hypothetical protein ACRENB_01450 [Gemmatimonadales bacterium]